MRDIRTVLDTPWKARNALHCALVYSPARLLFALNGIRWQPGWRLFGVPIIQKHRHSRISFGPGLCLRSSPGANPLGVNHAVIIATWQPSAILEAGANFCMTGGALCAATRIAIGNNVAVGVNTIITDTDFHPLDPEYRKLKPADGRAAPVEIADDVFIGMQCLILKGVTIGRGSVIGAGSVVTRDVPPHVVAAGNPARVVRTL
ncbi:MAG TPA: acyltransferase [Anaerolineae bacterium]|nr:acyltransferase [Anaerolineae bacterium]HOR00744.1 acyltransferase [Anaerolineae bacterium]HPL27247.1 acyltransferase [Anaerolineae bacterium]